MNKLIVKVSNNIQDLIGIGTEILLGIDGEPIAMFIEGNFMSSNPGTSIEERYIDTLIAA